MDRIAGTLVAAIVLGAPVALPRVSAQVVQGRVLDAVRGTPIAGALIELRDSAGVVRARAFTAELGAFLLMPPVRQQLSMRVLAIGYVPRPWEPLGSMAVGDLKLAPHAVAVQAIRALADRKGCQNIGDAELYSRLYRAATDALEVMNATITGGVQRFEVEEEVRVLSDNRVVSSRTARRGLTEWPIASIATDSLRDHGFAIAGMTDEGPGRMWHGPDLAVLFADWFQDRYCFTVKEPDAKHDYIAIRFEPARKSKLVELEGEIHLDPASLAVRELRYTHVHLPDGVTRGVGGGVVRFASDPAGTWIPVYWSIRAPIEVARPRRITRSITTGSGPGGVTVMPPPGAPVRLNVAVERVGRVLGRAAEP